MSVQYHYQHIVNDDASLSGNNSQSELDFVQSVDRQNFRLPKVVGIVQVSVGLLIAFLGLVEVLVVPISDNGTASMQFNKATCYGAGLYAGLLMVITGSMTLRASLSRRKTTVHNFYNLTVLTFLLYAGLTVFIIVAYSLGWNSQQAFPVGSRGAEVHAAVSVLVIGGVVMALTPLVTSYDHVCCGPGQLWHWWTHCLCDACSTRPRTQQPSESDSSATSAPVALLI